MISETSVVTDFTTVRYDADCPWCVRLARLGARLFSTRQVRFAPLPQGPSAPDEMQVVLPEGKVLGGADGLLYLARTVWWGWPLRAFASLPAGTELLRSAYRWIAARRPCARGNCAIRPTRRRLPALLAIGPVLASIPIARTLPPWACMWTLCAALFFSFKIASLWGLRAPFSPRLGAYLFLWPGMDAQAFLNSSRRPGAPPPAAWLSAAVAAAIGASLVWLFPRIIIPVSALAAGWSAMIGIVLVLHFGSFRLLAFAWQSAGVDAEPIMREPLLARSVRDFWGNRWNRGFSDFAHRAFLRPFSRTFGPTGGLVGVFFISGLIHELVISLPARGGYGLPTLYFLIQGAGAVFERSISARQIGLRGTVAGRIFTIATVAGPAFALFHPPFVHRVILPFLQTIHAL